MRKYLSLLLCLSAVILLSGCWNSKEPKELDVIDSVLYDKEPDGTYIVYAEIMNPQGLGGAGILGGAGGNKSSFITTMGTGPSIREAISHQTQKEMIDFGGHNKARFLTERFAQEDITPLLDMITRENLTDEKPFLVVVKTDDSKKVFDCMIGRSSMVGDYIEDLSLHQPKDKATGVFVSTLEFIRDYYTEGKEPVTGLALIEESSDKPSGNIKLSTEGGGTQNYVMKYEGLAAFKNGRLVGMMDADEAESYNFIVNKVQYAFFTVSAVNGDHTAIHITASKAEIKSDLVDGKAVVNITIKVAATISEESGGIDVTKPSDDKILEGVLNSKMEQQILEAVKKAQTEFKSDIFGFGEALHIQHPEKWKTVRGNWNDDYFANAQVNLTVKTDIVLIGEIEKPFKVEGAHP